MGVKVLEVDILKEVESALEWNEAMEGVRESVMRFVVKCCGAVWAVVESEYTLFPMAFAVDESMNEYDSALHERECDSDCETVRYCMFPAVMHRGVYLSKMFVVCIE